jgi:anti-anti-sigma factor
VAYEGLTLDLTPPGTIDLRPSEDGEEAVLTPTGIFDGHGTTELERQLDHWERVGWPSRLVIDLSQSESLSIAGLKSLISVRKEQPDTVIALAGLSESVRQVIELAGFRDYFAIYPTAKAALAALQATETLKLPGQLISDLYRIESRLGDKWLGALFKATNIHNNQTVALTVLSASFGGKAIEQFVSQAQKLTSFDHPNIARILDCQQERGFSYIVEEFVQGQPLKDLLADSSGHLLPAIQARDIGLDILSALEYAHSRGVIHYSLSPRNVLLADELKLTGFGLGGLEDSHAPLLKGPLLLHEAPYLAPEQILGQIRDARTDLYALGAVLYELFTGRSPFSGAEQAVMQAHLYREPVPPGQLNPQLSRSLEYLILKLLAKNPDERYATAHQTRQILSGVIVGDEETTGLSTLLYRDQKPLFGRDLELAQMETVRDAVHQSKTPRLLLVRGETGIGKSRLVAEFLLRCIVDLDLTAVFGRCNDYGAPYTPYAEILTTIFNKGFVNPQSLAEQSIHLTHQIPGLASILGPYQADSPNQVATSSQHAQWYFFETVLRVLAKLGPAILFIDDAAHLDEASVALTRFLIRRGQLPLMIILAGRDDEEANPWLTAFQSSKKEIIHLQPLLEPEVKSYLASLIGGHISDDVVAMVQKRTHGNPYFVEEIVNHLIEKNVVFQDEAGAWMYQPNGQTSLLPPSLMESFSQRMEKLAESRRIEDLTEGSRQALTAAATIGAEFDLETWLATLASEAGPQEALAMDILDEAVALRLLRQTGEKRYTFDPVDIADVLVSSQPAGRLRDMHRRIAAVLSQQAADPITISHHFQEAELTAEAARYLEKAGGQAITAGAIDEAITYYDRALVLVESLTGYETLGNLYRQNGAFAASTRAFEQALKLAERADDTPARARIRNELARVSLLNNMYDEARQAALAVLDLSGVSATERAKAEAHLGTVSWVTGQLTEAETWCGKSLKTFAVSGDQEQFAAVSNQLGLVSFSRGRLAAAVEAISRALEIYTALNDGPGRAQCLNNLGRIAIDLGEFEQAQEQFSRAQELFEKANDVEGLMLVYTNRGRGLLRQGQPRNALLILRQAVDQAKQLRTPTAYFLGDMYLVFAQANLQCGNLSQAKDSTEDALSLVEVAGNEEYIAAALATLAQINEAEGEYSSANTLFERALALFEEIGNTAALLSTRLKYAQFLAAQDRLQEAEFLELAAREEAGRLGLYL